MITFSAVEHIELTISASGAITLPSNTQFTSGNEYIVLTLDGHGSVDDASQTATDFDYTVEAGAGPCRVAVISKIPGRLMAHID